MRRKQLAVRYPDGLIEKLDAWLRRLNQTRRVPLTRSELVVGVLDWAAEAEPAWEQREAPLPDHTNSTDRTPQAPRRVVELEEAAKPAGKKRGR